MASLVLFDFSKAESLIFRNDNPVNMSKIYGVPL